MSELDHEENEECAATTATNLSLERQIVDKMLSNIAESQDVDQSFLLALQVSFSESTSISEQDLRKLIQSSVREKNEGN